MINISVTHAALLGLFYIYILATIHTIYTHRSLCHGAVVYNQRLVTVFHGILWLFYSLQSRWWAANHKLHHKYSDTATDDISPKNIGMLNALLIAPAVTFFRAMTSFRKIEYPEDLELEQIVSKIPDTGFFYRYRPLGMWINLAVHIVLFGWIGFGMWLCILIVASYVGIAFGNGIVHLFGYQNFDNNDRSKNVFPIAILFGGEELHNNHHRYPGRANFAYKWWEFDIGYFYICVLQRLGLAKIINDTKPGVNKI
jgi:stearoyl-CoA desaturase (delta-9 desaturase)